MKEALPGGGAERQLALITKYLPERWERRVWTMGGGPFVEVIRQSGQRVDVSARGARLDARPAADLWRLLREWRPDVVHSWDWMSSLAALPVCRALGIPVVDGTIRNGIARRRRALPLRAAMAASRLIVANSQAGLRAWGVGPQKGRVVYNAFDPARWSLCDAAAQDNAGAAPSGDGDSERGGTSLAAPSGRTTVVMTGRMVAHKDFATVVAAAAELDAGEPGRWRFVLLGDGPERARLVELAGDLVARGVVAFVDPGLEVLPLVGEAQVGVLMSNEAQHREGCSNAIMEYMACGLPVVCSAGGGNPELVVDGETGFLVPAADGAGLAGRLRELAVDRALALRLGEAGRARLTQRFTVPRLIHGLERVYWEALS